jgi:HD-GYP domain-containing protein (c-di-GMP phosphodiesterase class II)
MKSIQGFRFKIFMPLFLLLMAVSAITCAAATAAIGAGHSAVPSTAVAILTSLAVCGLASQIISAAIARESRQLAAAITSPPEPPQGGHRMTSLVYAEVEAAWDRAALKLDRTITHQEQKSLRAQSDMCELISTISKAMEERSPLLRGHSERVAEYSAAIAREMRLDEHKVERIRLAGMIHDFGMIGIGDASVKKSRLVSVKDFEILRAHPVRGASILRSIESMQDLIPAVELHHESLDGTGYPYGLEGDDIPLEARIVAVADTFDTLTCADPVRPAIRPDEAIDILYELSGQRLDSNVVAAFIRFLERVPSVPVVDLTDVAPAVFARENVLAEARRPCRVR